MILQIPNTKIVADIPALNAISSPSHGDCYFVTSEGKTYSYYNTSKNTTAGVWEEDVEAILYSKVSTLEVGYTDVSAFYPDKILSLTDSITDIYNKYSKAGYSYWQMRYIVKEIVAATPGGFDDFSNDEKEILSVLCVGNQNSTITYYMNTKGLTLTQAQGLHVQRLSENTAKRATDAKDIVASPLTMQIGIKYLTWVDPGTGDVDSTQANNLTHAIQGFLTELERYAVLGLEYNDEREGIMDYFESTNSYASGGLKNYVFNPDIVTAYGSEENARLAMIAELQEVFIKGNI